MVGTGDDCSSDCNEDDEKDYDDDDAGTRTS